MGSFETAEALGGRIRHEALRRGLGRTLQVVFLGDGAAWIWELARVNFPLAIGMVGLDHAWERLHALGQGRYAGQKSWAVRMDEQGQPMLKHDQVTEGSAAARRRLKD